MCAFGMPVRKTNSAVFDSRPVCASLSVIKATEQKWEEIRPVVRKGMRATEGLKREEGRKHIDD